MLSLSKDLSLARLRTPLAFYSQDSLEFWRPRGRGRVVAYISPALTRVRALSASMCRLQEQELV